MREIRTLRVMRRGLETEFRRSLGATAPVPDPTRAPPSVHLVRRSLKELRSEAISITV